MKDLFKRQNALVIEWCRCPQHIKDEIAKSEQFRNDIVLEHVSELAPNNTDSQEETWADNLTMESLQRYHQDQRDTNGYTGTLDEFIKGYGLVVDKWLIDCGVDLDGVEAIYIRVSW